MLPKRMLGSTELEVSPLCFGVLTIGPLQSDLPLAEGVEVLSRAVELGINFFDTAQSYGTYPYLRELLRQVDQDVVIASKSYAYTAHAMALAVDQARRELNRDRIEIFLLHEQESALTLAGHREALDYLLKAKERGIIQAVGISTHSVEACATAATMPEIDVIHPLVNRRGIGVIRGNLEGMLKAITTAAANGIGVYAMKPLAGGHLIHEAQKSLAWALDLPVASVAVGMQSVAEVEVNVAWAQGEAATGGALARLSTQPRRLLIQDWCQACGNCVDRCRYHALSLDAGRAVVDMSRCVLCGYCAAVCPDFCIKVI